MNVIIKSMFATLLLIPAAVSAQTTGYFGFAPLEVSETEISGQGSGKNMYIETAIRLDPKETPYLENLKGCQIVGVRCYLRADYKQKIKGYSTVNLYEGTLQSEPTRKAVNFTAGWNEVMFDEPYTLGDTPVYVGYRVFELMDPAAALPVVSYREASITGGYFVCANRGEWEETKDRGVLLIQAIISDPTGKAFEAPGAAAHAAKAPRVVAPDASFDGAIYVHNFSANPISAVNVESDAPARRYPLTFDTPIPGYGSAMVDMEIATGTEEGLDIPLTMSVTSIDGEDVAPAHFSTTKLYVSRENYVRIPLIEEFTSLDCVNCPFMAYFLEKGREAFGQPHVFVAHHSGFSYDLFTQPVDKELEYLFYGNKYNPAACYDRTILTGQTAIMISAKTADVEPYTEYITEVYDIPAIASVKVNAEQNDDKISVTVNGSITLGEKLADGKVYLSTYLVEDNIPRSTGDLWQSGVDFDLDPDSPADLYETYRHNGVIRANLCTDGIGDLVEIDADGKYSVTYPEVTLGKGWNAENCHVVAFLHRINKANPRDNYVLNAGDSKPFESAGINEVSTREGSDALRYRVTADRCIIVSTAVRSARVYNAYGAEVDATAPLAPGVYVLQVTLPGGEKTSRKIAII